MKKIPAFPMIPESLAEVHEIFGNINDFIRADGTLSPDWEKRYVARVALPEKVPYAFGPQMIERVTIHKELVPTYNAMLIEIWEAGLESALGPYGGGFVFRANRNAADKISLHAYALAHDWSPIEFPNGSKKKRDPKLVTLMTKYGFLCGQAFHGTPDPQHFQFAIGV